MTALKVVLHSVSYAGVWRGQATLPVEEVLVKARQLGYDGIMLMAKRSHVSPLDYDAQARKRLRGRVEELGLEVACLAGYTDFTGGIDQPGIPVAEIQASYTGQLARLAHDLGCTLVRIFTGYERARVPVETQWATLVQGLKLAAREAAQYGVTLAVQNHHDIANHHEGMLWLLEEVNEPNVKAAFDAWAPALQGLSKEELMAAVRKMAPFVVHTTVADYLRLPRFRYDTSLNNFIRRDDLVWAVPAGQGFVDYRTFFETLLESGYEGCVAYEMCSPLRGGGSIENLDRCAAQSVKYIRELCR